MVGRESDEHGDDLDHERIVELARYDSLFDAQLVVDELRKHGLKVTLDNGVNKRAMGIRRYKVMVFESDVGQARAVIEG